MAKRVIPDYYSFNPATKTIIIPNRVIGTDHFLLITNASSNTVIYNFSDPDLTAQITSPFSSTGTKIVLTYNTTAMGTSDALMIMVDEDTQVFTPDETFQDPTNKLRVASPQSLIDTDFEYGLQPIKWESLTMVQNYPAFFFRGGGNSLNIATVAGGNQTPRSTMTVTTNVPHNLQTSDMVSVTYTGNYLAEGVFPVLTVPSTTTFTYTAKGQINGNVQISSTSIQAGSNYDSDNLNSRIIQSAIASDNAAVSMITVTTTGKHGLMPGSPIMVNSSLTTTINGVWTIFDVPTPTTFRYQTPGIQTGTATPVNSYATGTTTIMVRPEANFVHRPSDGGVMVTTQNLQEGVTAIRQSRRYFRYQSGKGIQMSTGTKFCPHFDFNTITAAGTTATVTTQQAFNVQSGTTIVIEGVDVNAGTTNYYNGTFTVASATQTSNTFTYTMTGTPGDLSPGGVTPQGTIKNWKGAEVRVGFFDFQNGFYFAYDGQTMFATRRNSVRELMGTVTATSASTTITGTNTKFNKQLVAGDYIVIRGMSYQVIQVDSDTSIDVTPPYRGNTVSGVRVNLTQNIRIPQSQWNLDRCDGTGPSGYVLDVTKMQMCYIDYTWYGAGFVRFGFRLTDGNVVFVHKMANNNVNNQAYMRSGNLPTRYEVTNIGPYTRLVSGNIATNGVTLQPADTVMVVKDAQYWASSGTVLIQQNTSVEVIAYTGKAQNTTLNAWNLTGLSRRQTGGTTSNMIFIPSEYDGGAAGTSSQASITYITCDCAPVIMHWGTSVIMDGGYDEDRSIQFAYTKPVSFTVGANTSIAVLSLRLAPSVDNSITGQMGAREIVNRMQLQTKALGLVASTSVQVLGILNCAFPASATAPVFPGTWTTTSVVQTIGSGSLAQVIDHTGVTTIITGGEQIFGFVTGAAGDTYDISGVRDLGASIISGNGSQRTPGYPNGPDILTIVVRNTNTTPAFISNLRLGWTEAQA